MRKFIPTMLIASVLAICGAAVTTAHAEVTIGITLPLTGPASGIGIPMQNAIKLWPEVIGGEKVRVVILDDATDPGKGASNARRFITEDKVDLLVGSVATPVAASVAEVALDAKVPQLAMSPVALPAGRDSWTFRVPHSNGMMATAIVNHMVKSGVKTAAFLGYTDAYGESWLNEAKARMEKAGIKLVGAERFSRSDTAVTAQALKLTSAQPDAILIAASGSGAAMPHLAMIDRGFKGNIYQTHGAATRDLIRVGGKGVEGALVSSSPVVVADQLPADHRLKKEGMRFIQVYEKAYGAGSRNALSAHGWDAYLILDKVIPAAIKKARPGTPEFRTALRDAFESVPGINVTGGVLDYTSNDHWGYKDNDPIIMKVVNGDYKFEQ